MNARLPPRRVAIGLGSSLGPRRRTLEGALWALDRTPGVSLIRASGWYRTPPLRGGTAQGWFLNGVAVFHAAISPHRLLARCRMLEDGSGRRRAGHWADRTLDLDVLLVEDEVLDTPTLTLPHPAIDRRTFVLSPLLEVWPDAVDPRTGLQLAESQPPTGPRAVRVAVVARAPRPVTPPDPCAPGDP